MIISLSTNVSSLQCNNFCFLACKSAGNLTNTTLESGEVVVVSVVYSGTLPMSSSIVIEVKDAVTEFNLCFNTEYNVPVTIESSK